MKLHKFTATTVSQAMARVRKELGEDAIIISSIEERGLVHITAAAGDADISTNQRPQNFSPLFKSLDEHGITEIAKEQIKSLIHSLSQEMDDPQECLAESLENMLSFEAIDLKSMRRPLAVIGPPGAGKTASIAKLAVAASLENLNPLVITTDAEKAGAIEQLRVFTKAISIPLKDGNTPASVRKNTEKHKGLVLLDSTGLNPYDKEQMSFTKSILEEIEAVPILVMPAGLDRFEAEDMIRLFAGLKPQYLFVTKLDMCRRFGSVIGLAISSNLPLSHYSKSPHISFPLIPFTSDLLAEFIYAEEKD